MVQNNHLLEKRFQKLLLVLACAFTLFVVYGSLVPFTGREYSLAKALEMFAGIAYLELGVASRADWVANGVIYLPVGFFLYGYLHARKAGPLSYILSLVCLSFLSVAVEFFQIFVTPRTVSLNDLIAENIGLVLGAGLWIASGRRLLSMLAPVFDQRRIDLNHLLVLYCFVYLFFSFFPFDFYISWQELKEGLAGKSISLFWFSIDDLDLRYLLLRVIDFSIALPVGLLACQSGIFKRVSALLVVAIPLLLLIELVQVMLASGSVLLFSVLLKTAGIFIGWQLANSKRVDRWLASPDKIIKVMNLLVIPYLVLLCLIKGWRFPGDISGAGIASTLSELNFIPFYYHYFVTEMWALKSLLGQLAMMAPLGCYFYFLCDARGYPRPIAYLTLIAIIVSFVLEVGVLLLSGRPDPTNVLIAVFAAWAAYYLTGLIYRSLIAGNQPIILSPEQEIVVQQISQPIGGEGRRELSPLQAAWWAKPLAVILLGGLLLYLFNHPLLGLGLLGLAGIVIVFLWRWPQNWLLLLPAALPLLDLYVISGRFFMTELDALILLIAAVGYWRGYYLLPVLNRNSWLLWLLVGLALSYLISVAQVLLPWPGLDVSSFSSYYSPFNALRISKSLLWALLLIPLINFEIAQGDAALKRFGLGMIVGFLIVFCAVFLERLLFPGLLDFANSDYRVKGTFATMHSGGAHIDAYLMMALPFLATPLLGRINFPKVLSVVLLFTLMLYAVFVTYSRAPYAVAAALILLVSAGFLFIGNKKLGKRWVAPISLLAVSLSVFWLSTPFLYTSVLSQRLEHAEQDRDARLEYWRDTIGLVSKEGNYLWGNGPGSFPYQLLFQRGLTGDKQAVHELVELQDERFLRLTTGDNIYTTQYVHLNPEQTYRLKFNARAPEASGHLVIPLCEIWIIDSARCVWQRAEISAADTWQEYEFPVSLEEFRPKIRLIHRLISRPIALSLFSSKTGSYLDINNIQLIDSDGRNLLDNGGFEQGKDYWFFTADNHSSWHSFNVFVNFYHDYGLVGLSLLLALMVLVVSRLIRMIRSGQKIAVILLASLCGFLGIGLVGSLFEVPQLSLLFYLLLFISALLWHNRADIKVEDEKLATERH